MSSVQWAAHGCVVPGDEVGVGHSGFEVFVADEFLDGADVVAGFQEVDGEGVAEGGAGDGFGDAGQLGCFSDGSLGAAFAEVVAAGFAGAGVNGEVAGGEDVLPGPVAVGVGVSASECGREVDVAVARFQVALVDHSDAAQVFSKGLDEAFREYGDAGYFSGGVAHVDLAMVEVEVPDAEAQAFDQPEAGAEYEFDDELVDAGEGGDHCHGFFSGEDDGQSSGVFGSDGGDGAGVYGEYFAVEEEDGGEGLVLGGGGDVEVYGQVGDEGGDFGVAHFFGVAFVVEEDVAFDPVYVGPFGADGVVFVPDGVTDLVEQFFGSVVHFVPAGVARSKMLVYTNLAVGVGLSNH